jgi:hypothetical protein
MRKSKTRRSIENMNYYSNNSNNRVCFCFYIVTRKRENNNFKIRCLLLLKMMMMMMMNVQRPDIFILLFFVFFLLSECEWEWEWVCERVSLFLINFLYLELSYLFSLNFKSSRVNRDFISQLKKKKKKIELTKYSRSKWKQNNLYICYYYYY